MGVYSINILHLYPDLLNLYGDKGNIECLRKRLEWRDIEADVRVCTANEGELDVENADIIFLGGGADREIEAVAKRLMPKKQEFKDYVENGGVMLALCSGFPLVGQSIETDGKITEGLGILDITTKSDTKKQRLTGNVVLECDGIKNKVIGFENHGSRTDIGCHTPFGKVIKGFGNDGQSGFEGVAYKNLTGTYLHGPLLPKNPELCDRVLLNALKRKYKDFGELSPLEDSPEIIANEYMEKRI